MFIDCSIFKLERVLNNGEAINFAIIFVKARSKTNMYSIYLATNYS